MSMDVRRDTQKVAGPQECAGCGKKINERFLLKALDMYWHEDCLKCGCCDCRLGEVGSTLFTKANLILCKRDYLRLFGATGYCAACNKVIPAFEMVMRARSNVYHLECFACQQCNHRFCVGDRFYLWDNKILCEYDYEERLVFSNIPYSGGGNQPITTEQSAGTGPVPGPGPGSCPGSGPPPNLGIPPQQPTFQQQLMNHINDVKSPLQMNTGGGQMYQQNHQVQQVMANEGQQMNNQMYPNNQMNHQELNGQVKTENQQVVNGPGSTGDPGAKYYLNLTSPFGSNNPLNHNNNNNVIMNKSHHSQAQQNVDDDFQLGGMNGGGCINGAFGSGQNEEGSSMVGSVLQKGVK